MVAEILFKVTVVTPLVAKFSLFVTKITFVVAEITFIMAVITSLVSKFVCGQGHLYSGSDNF